MDQLHNTTSNTTTWAANGNLEGNTKNKPPIHKAVKQRLNILEPPFSVIWFGLMLHGTDCVKGWRNKYLHSYILRNYHNMSKAGVMSHWMHRLRSILKRTSLKGKICFIVALWPLPAPLSLLESFGHPVIHLGQPWCFSFSCSEQMLYVWPSRPATITSVLNEPHNNVQLGIKVSTEVFCPCSVSVQLFLIQI